MSLIALTTFAALSLTQPLAKTFTCTIDDSDFSPLGTQFTLTLAGEAPADFSGEGLPYPEVTTVGAANLTVEGDASVASGLYSASLITAQTRLVGYSTVSVGIAMRALSVKLNLVLDPQLTDAFGHGTVERIDHGHQVTTILVSCK